MDGISAGPGRQLPFSGGTSCEGFQGAVAGSENASLFLIHTNKSGGGNAKPFVPGSYNQDNIAKDVLSVIRESDQDPVEKQGVVELPERLEKYARQTADAAKFGGWLAGQTGWKRYQPIGRRVATCGSHLVFHDYYRRDLVKLAEANNCCTALLCPFCAGRRAVRHLQNAIPKLRHVLGQDADLRPYLLTVTIRDEEACRPMFRRIRAFWSKVIAMRRESRAGKRVHCTWASLEGGIMSWEIKRGSGSGLWHIHGHALVVGPPGLVSTEFQEAWSELVGYWAQCDLRPLKSTAVLQENLSAGETETAVAKDLLEVFKYALKFNAMSFEDRFQAYRDLQGQRLVMAFGAFYGLKFEDEFLDDATGLEDEPYLRLVYSAIGAPDDRKYSLRRSQRIEPSVEGDSVVDLVDMDAGQVPSIDGEY